MHGATIKMFYVNLWQINVYICRQQSLALRPRKHNFKKTDVGYVLRTEQNCLMVKLFRGVTNRSGCCAVQGVSLKPIHSWDRGFESS